MMAETAETPRAASRLAACVVVTREQRAFARVLTRSFLRYHPGARFMVLLLDGSAPAENDDTQIEWLSLTQIGLEPAELEHLPVVCTAQQLAIVVKPQLLRSVLARTSGTVFYFSAQTKLFSPIDTAEKAPILIAPYTLAAPDDLSPGVFDPNFIGVSAGGETFLESWSARMREVAFDRPDQLAAGEQRWFDAVPATCNDALVLRDPACNVSHWNLPERQLSSSMNGYAVGDTPLCFFRFDGYDPARPHLLSTIDFTHPRVLLSERPAVAQLCSEYRADLLDAGWAEDRGVGYAFDQLEDGLRIDPPLRLFYARALNLARLEKSAEPPSPFAPGGEDRFVRWLREPARENVPGLSRYALARHAARPDLREAFPDPLGEDAPQFADWFRKYGGAEENTPEVLLPEAARLAPSAQPPPDSMLKPVVNIAGYFGAELGLGEAARRLAEGLAAAGVAHDTFTYRDTSSRQDHPFVPGAERAPRGDLSIICVNADQLPRFARRRGAEFLRNRYSIGLWFWEVEDFPPALHHAFELLDEIWVTSEFLRRSLSRVSPDPVFAFDLPIVAPAIDPSLSRVALGLPPDRFVFLFSLDFLSVLERKNPFGLIEAFRRAFRPGEGPVLVIKTINGHQRVAERERLLAAIAGQPDIILRDGYLSAVEKNTLTALCDCYVSLHRSEGYGLTLAEAMALGRPVIATAYSGNMSFMNPENSWLCGYTLQDVGPDAPPYPPSARWAAPDLDEAAGLLRRVYEHPNEASQHAAQALHDIEQMYSPTLTGRKMRQRIEAIRRGWRSGELKPRAHITFADRPVTRIAELEQAIRAAARELAEQKQTAQREQARVDAQRRMAEADAEALRAQLEQTTRLVWDEKVRRADSAVRIAERDRALTEIRGSGVWKIAKPLWKIGRHLAKKQTAADQKADAIAFGIDAPAEWKTRRDVLLIRGWCCSQSGREFAGVRVRVGRKSRFARYGLERPDVAAQLGHLPAAARSGFTVEIRVPRGQSTVRLEAIEQGGDWQPFFEHELEGEGTGGEPEAEEFRAPRELRRFPAIKAEKTLDLLAPLFREHAEHVGPGAPFFSILTPAFNTKPPWLAEAAVSLLDQTFADWEWCLVDDGSTNRETRRLLEQLADVSPRLRIRLLANAGISAATNQALDLATGEYVCFLDHDDLLEATALEELARKFQDGFDAVYTDEDKLDDASGARVEPFFKPEWSPEYFRGAMYVGHLLCVRRELAARVRFDSAFDGVQDFEFMLRLSETDARIGHIPRVLYHWRKTPGSIAEKGDAKPEAAALQQRAVNAQLARLGLPARAELSPLPHRLQIAPSPRAQFPKISIIIPTKDAPALIGRCLESLFGASTYPEFEVILMDNGTTDAEALRVMANSPARRIEFTDTFNFSRANNSGARTARGEFLVFLNNDTEIITPGWLEQLLFYAEQPDIGAVGALLVYPDRTVQHAGVVLGMRGTADHVMRGFPLAADGYAGSLACAREVSALTAACMMMRRSLFDELGGFNEHFFTAYQDVDLCLRLRARNLRLICTPRAVVMHHESASRKTYYDMIDRMLLLDQWEPVIAAGDPYYNPNLVLERGDYSVRKASRA